MRATSLTLGDRSFDITDRALVMGILNRTPDSFYDKGATYALDDLLRRAERAGRRRVPTCSTWAGSRPARVRRSTSPRSSTG